MSILRRLRRTLCMVMLLTAAGGALAQDQANADPVFCKGQIADPDVAFQVDLCTAHAGCALVIKVHKTCTAVRGFAERLGTSIGQGVKTLFGTRKEVQPENIWEAVQTENTRRLDEVPEAKVRSGAIREALAKKHLRATDNSSQSAGGAVMYGEVKDGKLQGWGMKIGANGIIERGEYRDNQLNGLGDKFLPGANGAGVRATGEFSAGELQGEGAQVNSNGTLLQGRFQSFNLVEGKASLQDGSRLEGRFDSASGQLIQGSKYAVNGTLTETGTFRNGQLYVGERYADGTLVATVNRPREQMQQAEAQQAGNAERMRREAAERAASEERARQEAVAREQTFRDDLGRMNAGQLYAWADELSEKSQADKARQVWRALISRFPDHALAEIAAQKLQPPLRAAAPSAPATAIPSSTTAGPPKTPQKRLTPCELETANAKTELDRMTAASICAMNNEKPDPTRLAMARNDGPFGPSTGNVCAGEPPRNLAYEAALAKIPQADVTQLIRGAVVGIDMHLAALKQCAASSKLEQQIKALESQRASALRTCRQLASRDNCEQSPFR